MTTYEKILKELETTTTYEGLQFAGCGVNISEEMGNLTKDEARHLRQMIGGWMCEMEIHAAGGKTLKELITH